MEQATKLRNRAFSRQLIKQGFRQAGRAMQVVSPHLTYGSARVQAHRALTSDNGQEVMAQELAKIMTAEEVQESLTDIARNTDKDNRPYRVRTLELMARVHALLIDKSQVETTNVPNIPQSIADASTDELLLALTNRLRVSSQGVNTSLGADTGSNQVKAQVKV